MKEIPKDREILIKVDMGCGQLNNYLAFWNDHYDCFISGVNFFKKERIEAWSELPQNKDWNVVGSSDLLRDEEHAEVSDLMKVDLDSAAIDFLEMIDEGVFEPDYSFKEYLIDNFEKINGDYYHPKKRGSK